MLLMALAFTVMGAFFLLFFLMIRTDAHEEGVAMVAIRHSIAVNQLNMRRPEERGPLIKKLMRQDPLLRLTVIDPGDLPSEESLYRPPRWPFHSSRLGFGMSLEIATMARSDVVARNVPTLYFRLADGMLIKAVLEVGPPPPPPLSRNPLTYLLAFVGISLTALLFWVTFTLARPLSRLSKAASSFGLTSMEPVPLAETGPSEVSSAARAFNRMQARLNEMVERRTRMLAAISHDLRTPLTRLRLRIDLMNDEDMKKRNLADLDAMEAQLNGALSFLREGRSDEASRKIDVPSLLQGLADQYEDTKIEVALDVEPGLAVKGRSGDLNRALSNLIDNAWRYAGSVRLEARAHGNWVRADVVDTGPGIAREDRERLLQPFERGDAARLLDQGIGFGLGLATSKAIVEAHDGRFALADTAGGGLTVRISLPCA